MTLNKNAVQVNKLNFTQEETDAMSDLRFFLIKSSATQKVLELFGKTEHELRREVQKFNFDIDGLNTTTGKIFRGENYKLYPYVLLDFPKLFSTNSIFAFRTMFWWGHEFSFTLHLQGEALNNFRISIFENLGSLMNKEVYYCVNHTPWQYFFGKENYLPIEEVEITREEILTRPFIKLSRKIPVHAHDRACDYCKETFEIFMGLLK